MPKSDKLQQYLTVIRRAFDINKIISEKQKSNEIKEYYLTNHLAYLLFHNKDGFMHMGISNGEKYSSTDLLTHLKIIQSLIDKLKAMKILELGAGNGSNSEYLAITNPSIQFCGLDLSKKPIKKLVLNYKQEYGDFHELGRYVNNSFDLAFVIEALCHSNQKGLVLDEVYKKLKIGGIFVIFDGYTQKPESELSEDERIAKKLTEKTMAVDNFECISGFESTIKKSGFKILEKKDYSKQILPSLKRFERLALIFYKYPLITNVIKIILPFNLVKNSIAGLLMPILIQRDVACYYIHVLQKAK